jgi:HSP20 family molecular chaperone IbpA
MSSAVNQKAANYNQDFANLSNDIQKKKRQIVESGEEEIAQLKAEYQKKIDRVDSEGEAAINHIRKVTQHSIEGLKETEKNYQEKSQDRISELAKKEMQFRKNEQQNLAKFTANQRDIIAKTKETANSELEETYVKANQQRKEITQKLDHDSKSMTDKFKSTYDKEMKLQQGLITNMRNTQRKEVASLEKSKTEKLEKLKESNYTLLDAVNNKYKSTAEKLSQDHEAYIKNLKKESHNQVKNELEQQSIKKEALQKDYAQKVLKIHQTGGKKIHDLESSQKMTLNRQSKEFQALSAEQKRKWEERKKIVDNDYEEKIKNDKNVYEKTMKKQNAAYISEFNERDKSIRKNFRELEHQYNKVINKEKLKLANSVHQYQDKNDDPFYKIQNRGTEFDESSKNYTLKVFVPEYEKDNVKIRVYPDRVTVSGIRAFKDEVDQDGSRASTNNFQTFKEEFDFTVPVADKTYIQERVGDYIEVTIPKLSNQFQSKKLNKLA